MIDEKEYNKFVDESGSFVGGIITCKECGKDFEITSHEVSHFYNYGQSLPKRCKSCRDKRKNMQ